MPSQRPTEAAPKGYKGLRLARYGIKPNTGRMERFLKANGITPTTYVHWMGGQSLKEFGKISPTWTQRAWEVLIVENLEALQRWEVGSVEM